MFDLTGKVALVTGGNGGIGLGMAGGLAEAGATVVLAGRNADKSAAAAEALRGRGCKADAIEADVTDEARSGASVPAGDAAPRPARHPGQQRRHHRPQAAARTEPGRVATM